MTVVNFFADLRAKYPAWNDLKTFLTGDTGGKLLVVGSDTDSKVIIRYDKKVSDFSLPYTHAFRSVIWDTVANIPVSVAPFKAAPGEVNSVDLIQDFVEGVMLHAYRTCDDQNLHLSTRTKLGAATHFYGNREYCDLIRDVPEYTSLMNVFPVPNQSHNVLYTFASLVLQHPEHRIVAPITKPRLYVVMIGCVDPDGLLRMFEHPGNWSVKLQEFAPQTQVVQEELSLSGAKMVEQEAQTRGAFWQGLVFKNSATLVRWRIRNPNYTPIRELRGSEADVFARFLRLRKAGQFILYLSYYPEETQTFYDLEEALKFQTQELFKYYTAVHCKKHKKELKDIQWPYRTHVYKLHGLYRINKIPITLENVIHYVNELDTHKQRAFLVVMALTMKVVLNDEIQMD